MAYCILASRVVLEKSTVTLNPYPLLWSVFFSLWSIQDLLSSQWSDSPQNVSFMIFFPSVMLAPPWPYQYENSCSLFPLIFLAFLHWWFFSSLFSLPEAPIVQISKLLDDSFNFVFSPIHYLFFLFSTFLGNVYNSNFWPFQFFPSLRPYL